MLGTLPDRIAVPGELEPPNAPAFVNHSTPSFLFDRGHFTTSALETPRCGVWPLSARFDIKRTGLLEARPICRMSSNCRTVTNMGRESLKRRTGRPPAGTGKDGKPEMTS
ncbi:MAG: hypothetical protein ACKV22_31065, partial [Bryobacteraceae bacterium]